MRVTPAQPVSKRGLLSEIGNVLRPINEDEDTLIHPVERFVDVKPVAVTSQHKVGRTSITKHIGAGGGPQIPLHPSTTTKKK